MIRATKSEVKDGTSAGLRRIKSGESVLVMERRTPVARIAPMGLDSDGGREGDSVDREAKSREGFALPVGVGAQDARAAARLAALFDRRACIHFTANGSRAASRAARMPA